MSNTNQLYSEALALLKALIATPSFSKEENGTAEILIAFFTKHNIAFERIGNNIYAKNKYYAANKPSLLLNSHHDTVKPNKGYTLDPFAPIEKESKLFGLGSNDAGGCLVSLITTFLHFYEIENSKYNIVFAASAEEEACGLSSCLHQEWQAQSRGDSEDVAVSRRSERLEDCPQDARRQ